MHSKPTEITLENTLNAKEFRHLQYFHRVMIRTILFSFLLTFSLSAIQAQDTLLLINISSSEEDAEQEGDFVDLNDLELDVGWDNGSKSIAGLFFRDINLVREAPIQSCFLALTTQAVLEDTIELVIRLEDAAFPNGYDEDVDLLDGRSFLGSGMNWTFPPAGENVKRLSPDLTDLVKELIDDNRWNASANLNFIIEPAEDLDDSVRNELQFFSYDQIEENKRPQLRMVVNASSIDGIESIAEQGVSVYPNPARDKSMISLPGSSIGKNLILMDASGRIVSTQRVSRRSTIVSLEHLNAGVYFFRIGEGEMLGKIIHY